MELALSKPITENGKPLILPTTAERKPNDMWPTMWLPLTTIFWKCKLNNGTFHFYYGSALTQKQEYKAGAEELEKAIHKFSDPNAFILLGNNYKELGEFEKAKQAYLTAINMTPSKLYPKYLMAKLLIEQKNYGEAEKWAREILNTKEKVPTTAAKEIKEEMQVFLDSLWGCFESSSRQAKQSGILVK